MLDKDNVFFVEVVEREFEGVGNVFIVLVLVKIVIESMNNE